MRPALEVVHEVRVGSTGHNSISLEDSAANIRTAEGGSVDGHKDFTNAIQFAETRNEPTSAGIHLDFEDLLAAAIASVIIKRPKNPKIYPDVDRKLWVRKRPPSTIESV